MPAFQQNPWTSENEVRETFQEVSASVSGGSELEKNTLEFRRSGLFVQLTKNMGKV